MKRENYISMSMIGLGLFFMSGCASIMSSKTQVISIDSNPSGATVKINDEILGNTPLSKEMKRKSGQVAIIEKEGYSSFKLNLNTGVNSWVWGNILLLGPLGTTTDAANGTMVEYSPNQYLINLQTEGTTKVEAPVVLNQADKVKNFVVSQHSLIRADLAKGGGTHLSTLMTLLKISSENRNKEIPRIGELSQQNADPIGLSETLIAEYLSAK